MVRTEDIFNQINLESESFQTAMKYFEQEEIKYLEEPYQPHKVVGALKREQQK